MLIKAPDQYSFPSGHCASATLITLLMFSQDFFLAPVFLIWMILIPVSYTHLTLPTNREV